MTFRIPDHVTLRGRVWAVVRTPRDQLPADEMGHCDRESRAIVMRSDLSQEDELETFIHECMHAVRPWGVVSDEKEEILICNMDEGMVDAFKALIAEG